MADVLAVEVADVLRRAIRGEIPVAIEGEDNWAEVFSGNVVFWFADWCIVLFNDALDIDYVDEVTAPDGRSATFESWAADANPVDLLTIAEGHALSRVVENAEPQC